MARMARHSEGVKSKSVRSKMRSRKSCPFKVEPDLPIHALADVVCGLPGPNRIGKMHRKQVENIHLQTPVVSA